MSEYKSDIEIAQETELLPIEEVAAKIGLTRKDLELYGNYKAKLDYTELSKKEDKAKLILVTAITPTPAGEGKTQLLSALATHLTESAKKPLLHSGSLHSDLFSVLRAVLPAADMHRLCLWRILTFISQVISMQSVRQTTFLRL